MIRPTLLSAALWAVLSSAHAESAADARDARDFDRIQVTATRTERALADVPATVDVIDREQLDDHLVRDIKDLVRYEPGVSVTGGAGRFGLNGFRIRGLDANRVLIQTDGIAMPRSFDIGSFSNANRNFTDLETLKRVEIVRGPASSLYGSDALGGVVAFVTKDPADYLKDGKDSHVGLKFGYDGDWEGLLGSVTTAFGGERWSGMVNFNHRQGKETETAGEVRSEDNTRTAANPQQRDGRSLLGKLVYAPGEDQRFKLTVDANEDYVDTDVLSSIDRVTTVGMQARDHQTRARVSLGHEMDALAAGFADSLSWQVYRQDSETTQRTHEGRGDGSTRHREFNFDQRVYGLQATFHKDLAGGSVEHALTYGFDGAWTETRQKRDGYQVLANGSTSTTILPDAFPVRDFPISKTTELGLYVQDEMRFADGRLSLVPGLRVDHYELRPEVDAIFAGDNPGVAVADLTETSVSPKLGLVWRFADQWSLFAGYAHGFRSPPYNDVNLGFTNVMFGYTAIPNPDLKPETSDGIELGIRFLGPAAYVSLSSYYNDYRDFIESQRFVGVNDQGLMVFQSQNVADAEIYGAELKAGVDFGQLGEALDGWSLRGAVAWSRGQDKTDDVPLESIDPLRGSLGVAFDRDTWGVELAGSFARRKDRLASTTAYRPAGYGVLDLMAHWAFTPGAKLNVGVFNLGDRKYTDWSAITSSLAGNSPVVDRFTNPGRNVSVSLALEW
ncbi:TonB-dependent hemoglobin/transferrin/lactoferrin family receptor [Flavobacterium sp. MXW15]|uniref:TonB-dependent hemoglobin/transferrin/lactoferrin family receptor n=1 Tax=Xanthomonas chitinilytica TaxID=2989819 RepID=A0ABT3JSB6_9XANT|nr:TonB-dependent hemoglobin/transferrin/lactoferrin family receptor [Xanthomonas sp. H13-6]MCW4454150.1 TonB-dependent hemoglobin/transferrin/lactoferrin family receptor [Flavobacterium sp. MXW15]MCW4471384.1 TonB-dependent hemoglobin/transferrin/lactoferrin family receptor [Xanthomonas sp. H13-6]